MPSPAGGVHLVLPPSALSALPTIRRRPYLHFIVDNSLAAANAATPLAEEVERVAALAFPGALDQCRVTLANYERAAAAPGLMPLSKAAESVRAAHGRDLPCRGGFRADLAIAGSLLEWEEGGGRVAPDGTPLVPVFVVCAAAPGLAVASVDLAPFADLAPDVSAYYVATGGQIQRVEFGGRGVPASGLEGPRPVVLMRAGSQCRAIVPDGTLTVVSMAGKSVEVFDGGRFRPLSTIAAEHLDGAYAGALDLLETCRRAALSPAEIDAKRAEIVRSSRDISVLTPQTAFVLVENTAQEKMLARKERQSLGAHSPLEFEVAVTPASTLSTPEPGFFVMLPVVLALLLWHRRRRMAAGRR